MRSGSDVTRAAARSTVTRTASFAAALAIALLLAPPLQANDIARVLVQSSPLAGFRYHAAPSVWESLAVGDPLELVRERANPHDRNAVRVQWRGVTLGYIPRTANAALAWAMDRGERVSARIARLREHPNPRERVLVDVLAE